MFDTAYLTFAAAPQIDSSRNTFSVDGGRQWGIHGGANLFKFTEGEHTVVITSGNGEQWTVTERVKYNKMLSIRLEVDGADICDVLYRVTDANIPKFCATKLD